MSSGQLPLAPRCPCCAAILDGYTALRDETSPQPGDFTICLYCSEPLVFDALVTPQRPDAATRTEMLADPDVRRAIAATRLARWLKPEEAPRRR